MTTYGDYDNPGNGPDTRCRAWDSADRDEATVSDRDEAPMTVFEPTTPHRDRLAEALFKARHPGVETPPSDWWHRQMLQEADYLIEADVVADPEFVAWLAEKVTRVKGLEGRLRKQIVADICATFDEEIEWQQQTCKDDPGDDSAFGYLQGLKAGRSIAARVARGDHEATTHTTDNNASRGSGGSIPNPHPTEEQP